MQVEETKQFALSSGLLGSLRRDEKDVWSKTLERCSYVPVMYTNSSIEFQLAYQRGHGGNWQDLSCIVYLDKRPVMLWPLSISHKDGKMLLSSHGLPVLPPLFVNDCPMSSQKRIIKSCLDYIDSVAILNNIESWECVQSFNNTNGLSHWHLESMARGAMCRVHHELYVDLNLDISEIKSNFRKSYKPLITAGNRLWTVGVLDVADAAIWDEFQTLHFNVSGRKTRSGETWDLHLQELSAQQAFLVYLRASDGSMVGGGFFNFTRDEGMYAVAAYDRSLFDKPLGHVVQYRAIEELKNRGVRWYKIGVRAYHSDNPTPSDKEVTISEFKQGFASHAFPRMVLHYPIKQKELLA